ncbi:MAG: hypothetical protein PUE12_11125 [Oscillospiraceae bacterium]|nr:hypothetical protein [Oscillospiraceae bacterium]
MLINNIVNYCNTEYNNIDTSCLCKDCNHPSKCTGSCKLCLEQVHYPNRYSNGKRDYDCENMLNFYVCDYINKYASEMLYLLRKSEKLKELDEYHVLSIGCGAAPDLMAFERYIAEEDSKKEVRYFGIDKNNLWGNIHNMIRFYRNDIIAYSDFIYVDAMEYFSSNTLDDTNVIVFRYVISHFYNTNQIQYINEFFMNIIDKVVERKCPGEPLIILINDTNSCNRGRDHFLKLKDELQSRGYHGLCRNYYFNYRIQNLAQRFGEMHENNKVLFDLSCYDLNQYEPWTECSAAQLLIEIE